MACGRVALKRPVDEDVYRLRCALETSAKEEGGRRRVRVEKGDEVGVPEREWKITRVPAIFGRPDACTEYTR